MKPIASKSDDVGLLEYLEDIIGSNKHLEKIDELEAGLNEKNDERIEKTNRVKTARAGLDNLEAEKDTAVNFIKREREFMVLTNMLYFIELGNGVKIYNESIEKIHNLRQLIQVKKEEMKQKFQQNKKLVEEIQQLHQKVQSAEGIVKDLEHQFQQLEQKDVKIVSEKKKKIEDLEKLKEGIINLKKRKQATLAEQLRIEKELPNLEKLLKNKTQSKAKFDEEFEPTEIAVR